ncbi:hypothetical protein M378DRAFT_200584 [Amanita muscaria Koide BX008]|uniref:Uncharacterized protein n=1 Tax=Amanita muscaria (strain Koide BX008) TaxID=946122 RepID=A0A0C2S665_AMAMK|nr:hypothetical protein M378DRAFT_200584 [Amanita muscaria Koide BX008]
MSPNNLNQVNTAVTVAPTKIIDPPVDGFSLATSNTMMDPEKLVPDEQQYKYLGKRFNFKVVLSTFACSLVVAYTGFANNMARNNMSRINYAHGIPYNICMLLAYLAIACHAVSAVISGRGAVLCSDPDLIGEKHHTIKEFKIILSLCEHLNLHGIILFVLSVFGFSFFVFQDFVYPALFCGLSLLGVALIFCGKYRRLSLIHKDTILLWNAIKGIFGKT